MCIYTHMPDVYDFSLGWGDYKYFFTNISSQIFFYKYSLMEKVYFI